MIIFSDNPVSTNEECKLLAKKENLREGSVIFATRQRGGKGTKGRKFLSPEGGLYMSVLLRPDCLEKTVGLTSRVAVEVINALKKIFNLPYGIKWVIDIIVNGKKACGILCESAFTPDGKLDFVVVGIGINVVAPENGFAEEIKDIATALTDKKLDFSFFSNLASLMRDGVMRAYNNDNNAYREQYSSLSVTINKNVTIDDGNDIFVGRVVGFDDNFGMIVKNDNEERTFFTYSNLTIC